MEKPEILLIESSVAHIEIIKRALYEKYEVVVVDQPALIPDKLNQEIPRLVIISYRMAARHDFKLFHDYFSNGRKKFPILYLLHEHHEKQVENVYRMGGSDYILMPATHIEINARVDQQLQMSGLKSLLGFQQRTSQVNWAIMDRYMPFLFLNKNADISFVSEALLEALAVNKQTILGKNYARFALRHFGNRDFEDFLTDGVLEITEEEMQWVLRDQTEEGSENWFRVTFVPRFDEFKIWMGFSVFYQNINDQIKLKKLSENDILTGIANRYRLNQVIQNEIDRANRIRVPFSLIMFDIDFFKEINDSYGHLVGDSVLKELCQLVKGRIRRVDVFGRWGGEEFLIVCPSTNESGAVNLAKTYHELIHNFSFKEVGQVTCSFGVAEYPLGTDSNLVLSHADKALYRAKDNGRDSVEYFRKFEYDDG